MISFPKIGSKGKDVSGLIKNSVKLLGRDADVFRPAIYMTIVKSVQICLTFYVLYSFFISKSFGKGVLAIFLLIVLAPIISFISMRFKAITSWMIYEILQGKDTDMSEGSKGINGMTFTLFIYSVVDLILKSAKTNSNNDDSGSSSNPLVSIALSIFKEVWDLIKNFSLPAIVIDKASIKEIPDKLKMVKKNIPGTLVGVLGIDLVGGVLLSLFSFIQLPALFVGGALGYYGKGFLPTDWNITVPIQESLVVNLLPLFVILLGTSIFVSFLNSMVHLVKTSYFTTFYVSLTRPKEITDDLKDEVTHYLDFSGRLDGYTFFEKPKPKKEEGYDLDQETGEDLQLIRKLSNTFKKNVDKGLSEKKIYNALIKKGYSKDQLMAAVKMYRAKKVA